MTEPQQTASADRNPYPVRAGSYVVALVLAIGICTAINLFTIAVLWDALFSIEPGLSENATQVLTGWGGGVIGIIGAVVGYQAGYAAKPGMNHS